jgi:hypothetical protein
MYQMRNGFLVASGLISVVSNAAIAAGGAPVDGLGATGTGLRSTTPTGVDMPYRQISGYAQLPMRFEPNVGQAPAMVRYWSRGPDYTVALTDRGAIIALRQGAASGRPKRG